MGTARLRHQPPRRVAFVGRGRFLVMTLSELPLEPVPFRFWDLFNPAGEGIFLEPTRPRVFFLESLENTFPSTPNSSLLL